MTDQPITADQVRGSIGLLTEEVAADVLLLRSVDTLATWRSQKKGPAYVKLGKKIFYTINDLKIWIVAEAQAQIAARNEAAAAALSLPA